jgi:hypothetical protein
MTVWQGLSLGMFVYTIRVATKAVVLAVLFGLMYFPLGWGGMSTNAFAVHAGCAKGASVLKVDSGAWRSGWGLVGEGTSWIRTTEIEFAGCFGGVGGLRGFDFHGRGRVV